MNVQALLPNATVNRSTQLLVLAGWVAFALGLWLLAPLPLLPSPAEVGAALRDQWSQGVLYDLTTSLFTSLEAIALASVIGLGLAYLSTVPAVRPAVEVIGKLRFLSLTGVILIFILLAPNGHALKVWVLTFAIVTFLVHDMVRVIDDVPTSRYDHARTLGLGRLRVLREVVVRGTLADAFEALRMNAAMAWMMLTMVEGLSRSEGGVGVLLLNLNRHMQLDAIFGVQLLIFALGVGQDWIIRQAKRVVCPYAKS